MGFPGATSRREALKRVINNLLDVPYGILSREMVSLLRGDAPTMSALERLVRTKKGPELSGAVAKLLQGWADKNTPKLGDTMTKALEFGAKAAEKSALLLARAGASDPKAVSAAWNVVSEDNVMAVIGATSHLEESKAFLKNTFIGADGKPRVHPGIANTLIQGALNNVDPRETARKLMKEAEGISRVSALRYARTVQLNGWREATAVQNAGNSHILEYQIRVATFDSRACPACLALHGERYDLEEVVTDHWNGRCVAIGKVKGSPDPVNKGAGTEWLLSQPKDVQEEILGKKATKALEEGIFDTHEGKGRGILAFVQYGGPETRQAGARVSITGTSSQGEAIRRAKAYRKVESGKGTAEDEDDWRRVSFRDEQSPSVADVLARRGKRSTDGGSDGGSGAPEVKPPTKPKTETKPKPEPKAEVKTTAKTEIAPKPEEKPAQKPTAKPAGTAKAKAEKAKSGKVAAKTEEEYKAEVEAYLASKKGRGEKLRNEWLKGVTLPSAESNEQSALYAKYMTEAKHLDNRMNAVKGGTPYRNKLMAQRNEMLLKAANAKAKIQQTVIRGETPTKEGLLKLIDKELGNAPRAKMNVFTSKEDAADKATLELVQRHFNGLTKHVAKGGLEDIPVQVKVEGKNTVNRKSREGRAGMGTEFVGGKWVKTLYLPDAKYAGNPLIEDILHHEGGHALEGVNAKMSVKAQAFLLKRTYGAPTERLKDVVSGLQGLTFDDDERTRKDRFFHPYVGRIAGNGTETPMQQYIRGQFTTWTHAANALSRNDYRGHDEVVSMGMERMLKDPLGFAKEDVEHFDMILELMLGDY